MCAVCRGRGEVAAGITDMVVEYGPTYFDSKGRPSRACYPTRVRVNPEAWDGRAETVWLVEQNSMHPLWGIAVCVSCHGTGM